MAEDQAAADRSQESLDYHTKREFRSDQSEGRLSLNTTLQSECGSEDGKVSEGSSEQNRKRSRSRLAKWNKLLPRIRTISLPSERCLEVMAIEPQFEDSSESIQESSEKIEGGQTKTKTKTRKTTRSISSEKGMEVKGDIQTEKLSTSIKSIDLKARSALQELRKRTPRIRTISLPTERNLEMKALYPTESIQQMRDSFKREVEEVLKIEVIKEEDSDSTNTDRISDKIAIHNCPIEEANNSKYDIDLNKNDTELQNSEFTEDILDIPKEEKMYSETQIDSKMSHTAIGCPDVLKALTENEPIILEMTDTLKTQLNEVSNVLKAQMEKISGELRISSLESNVVQNENLNLKFEKDILVTDENLPYIDENGHEIIPSLKKSSLEISDEFSFKVYSVTEFKESEEPSNKEINKCHDMEDEATIITDEPNENMVLDQIQVIKTDYNELTQISTHSQETESVSQVQNSSETVDISDIGNINPSKIMKVQGISEEATCEAQNTNLIEETGVFDPSSIVLNVISDFSSSIHTKEGLNILEPSVEVVSEAQVQKSLEIKEVSEKLGECMSKPKTLGKEEEITETSENLIHVDTSENVTTKLNSDLNTEEIEECDLNRSDVSSNLDPHGEKKKSKFQKFNKQAGASIHGLGESMGESGKEAISQVQKKVTQSTSKLKQRLSSDLSKTTEIQIKGDEEIDGDCENTITDNFDDFGSEKVSTNSDTKAKRSKVHEWNKKAGARIHALGESVDDARHDIIKSLQKRDNLSTTKEVDSSDQCVTESVVPIATFPDENSGMPQKDIQDENVTNDQQNIRKRKNSKLTEWDKRAGAQIHGLGEAVDRYSQEIIGQAQKEVSNRASLLMDKGQSVEVTQATDLSINETVEGGEGQAQINVADINAEHLEVVAKNKPTKLHQWDKQTGARIHALGENIEGSSKEMVKQFRKSLRKTSNTENINDTVDTTCSSEDEILQLNLDDKSSEIELDYKQNENKEVLAKKSALNQWNKQAGARIHAMGDTVGEGSQEVLKKVQKGLTHSATLLKDKLPSVGSTQKSEEGSVEPIVKIETSLDTDNTSQGEQTLDESVDGTRGRSSKKNDWNKRTGAQIYHMTDNVGSRGRDVIKRVKRSVSRPRSMPVAVDLDNTEDIPAEETNVMNISIDSSVASKKSKGGFKQWDKKTGAKIHRLTESVGDRGRDVIKNVRKNISRPASVSSDMDANKDDKVSMSTVSKVSESSQERKKKSKFQEWNKKTGAQMYHITGSATDRVRSGITTVANSPPVEAATERGRVLVRQATATLKSRTASMPRGASAPGAGVDGNYSTTLPRQRGASSSPSRGGTLKRLSANLPPLPQQLRKVFPGRDSVQHPRDPSPSKPSRRQGPVGKNWVKVYDDISYVDDRDKNTEEDYPVLGHRVGPTVLPNAKALPTPPTPPPPRSRHANKPTQDLTVDNEIATLSLDTNERGRNNNRFKGRREKRTGTPLGRDTGFNDNFEDEGDALRRSARLEAPQGADEDDYIIPEALMPEKPVRGVKVYEDVIFKRKQQEQQMALEAQIIVANEIEIEEPKQQEQDMHRQHNILKAKIIVSDEIKIEEPKKPQRGVKVYEDIIFKRQQEKEKQSLDEFKIDQEQEVVQQTEDVFINKDEVLAPVQKPQRGIKVYEGINFKHQQEKQKQIQEEKKSQETIKEAPVVEDKPAKPQRGIKIYDKIEFKSVQYTFETDMDESVSEVTVDEPSTSSEATVIDGSLKFDVPSKPERGNKVYGSLLIQRHESTGQVLVTDVKETKSKQKTTEPVSPRLDELKIELQNSHLSLFEAPALEVARMDIVKAHEAPAEAQVVENSIPATPKVEAQPKLEEKIKSEKERVEKVKVTAVLEDVRRVEVLKKVGETPQVEVTTRVVDTAEIYKNISKTNDIEIEVINPEAEKDIADESIPPYARVHKETGGVGPLRSLTPADISDEDGPPPAVPPKRVGIRTITPTASFDLPPRPSRHLKPAHLKPIRGSKPRRPQINGDILPSRPQRGTKLYADVEPAKPKRHSKVIRIEEIALMKGDLQELEMPSKPTRRRRRSEKENDLEYEDVPEAVTARLTVALDHPAPLEISTDFYENIELKDGAPINPGRSRMRGRPPPPPPPKKGNIQKNYIDRNGDQSSQPSNKVDPSGSDSVVAQEVSTTDSISTPDEVCTTTTLTTTTSSSSQLDTDIDHNLKNIESSFATLDDVLQSLKSYSRESSRNRRVILGESDKERAKLEMEVNKRLEVIQSAEVVSADYQNVEVKSCDVTVKKASVSENDYKEEKSHLIQLPDKIEVKAEINAVRDNIKVAMTVSETQVLEKSKDVQSVTCMPKNAKLNDGTRDVKVAYAVEETQTVEKTQSLQKSKDVQSEKYMPKNAVVKDVKDEETSEVKVAVSVEETQTSEKASEVQCGAIKAHAELKDVKDEETEELKVAVTVQELRFSEKTFEVSSEVVKAHAEVKDVKDEETSEVKVAVTVVELQTEEKTSEVKSGEILMEKAIIKQEEINEEGSVLITEVCNVVTPPKSVHEPVPDKTLSLAALIGEDNKVSTVEEVTSKFNLIKVTVSGEESKKVEEPVSVQVSSDEVNSRSEATKKEGAQQTDPSDSKPSEEEPDTELMESAILQAGVADIASRLEGIRCALESVIVNYPPPSSSAPPPSTPSLNISTASPVPPPPHSTPILSPTPLLIDTKPATAQTISTNLQVHTSTSLCPNSPILHRAASPLHNTPTSYISYMHSIAASIQSTAGNLQYQGYESPVSSPEPPRSPSPPLAIYHSSSAHALEALDKSCKTFNDALEALEDPSLLDEDTPSTGSYKPPSILHLLSPSSSKTSVVTVQSSNSHPTPTDKIQVSDDTNSQLPCSKQSDINQASTLPFINKSLVSQTETHLPISKTNVAGNSSSSKLSTETSITDKLISELQAQQSRFTDSLLTISPDKISQEFSPQFIPSQHPPIEQPLSKEEQTLKISVEKPIKSHSVQIQQSSVEPSSTIQSHVKETSLEKTKIQQFSVEQPSTIQSHVKETSLEKTKIQQSSVEPPSTIQSHVKEISLEQPQIQQTSGEPSSAIQSHVKETSLDQPQIQQTTVEPSITQSSINQSQSQQTTQQEPPTTQQPTMRKSPSTSRFGLTVSPSSDNLIPWGYLGPARPPSPTESPSVSSPLLSPIAPVKRATSPVFGFTKVDPDSNSIPWQYLGPTTSSSSLPDSGQPISVHDSFQSSSVSTVTTSSKSSITESKTQLESSSSIPIPISHSSTATAHSHISPVSISPVAFGSPFPTSSSKPTARFTFGLPSVNSGVAPSDNLASCTSNIQDLQSTTSLQKGSSSTMSEVSSSTTASQQKKTEPEC